MMQMMASTMGMGIGMGSVGMMHTEVHHPHSQPSIRISHTEWEVHGPTVSKTDRYGSIRGDSGSRHGKNSSHSRSRGSRSGYEADREFLPEANTLLLPSVSNERGNGNGNGRPSTRRCNTLMRDGIMPQQPRRLLRSGSSSSFSSPSNHEETALVPSGQHTLPAVSLSTNRMIEGHGRDSNNLNSHRRHRTSSNDASAHSSSDTYAPIPAHRSRTSSSVATAASSSSSSINIGGGWIRTNEGSGRARFTPMRNELTVEGTSQAALFVTGYDPSRSRSMLKEQEWTMTMQVKCTGSIYILLYCQCEPGRGNNRRTSNMSSSAPNSSDMSFLAINCNSSTQTWSLELLLPASSASAFGVKPGQTIVLASVRDQALRSHRWSSTRVSMMDGHRLSLDVDGSTLFDNIDLSSIDIDGVSTDTSHSVLALLAGRGIGVGVVRSRATIRQMTLHAGSMEDEYGNVRHPRVWEEKEVSSRVTVHRTMRVAPPPTGAGVSERTAEAFGSSFASTSRSASAPSSAANSASSTPASLSPISGKSSSNQIYPSDQVMSRSNSGSSRPSSSDHVAPTVVRNNQLQQQQQTSSRPHRRPSPRRPYSSSIHGEDPALVSLIERTILQRDLGIGLDDVAALEEAKSILQENVVLPLILPHFFSGIRQPTKGILLHGPPGTGQN